MIASANDQAFQAIVGAIADVAYPENNFTDTLGTNYHLIGHSCANFTANVLVAGGQNDAAGLVSIWPNMTGFNTLQHPSTCSP